MTPLSETLGRPGLFAALASINDGAAQRVDVNDYAETLLACGVPDPLPTIHELEGLGLLYSRGNTVSLSTAGLKTTLLLEAVNGANLHDILRQLRRLDGLGDKYTLVREGMTTGFFKTLNTNPNVGRLYICSPWIKLSRTERRHLATAVLKRRRSGTTPQITVVTRVDDARGTTRDSLAPFFALGASVFSHSKLHAKIYIREPGRSGGYSMAVVGSQNLTRSKYLELGIKIEGDSAIIRKLVAHVLELTYYSDQIWCEGGRNDGAS